MEILKEACVGTYLEAKRANELGADRIELCANLKEGGITPSYGTILSAKENLKIPINVMIRPRGGSFVFTEDEIRIMELDIEFCREANVNAIVIGVLTEDNEIATDAVERLVKQAGDLSVTFHMAFDEIKDQKRALTELIDLGVDRVLTKGGPGSALDNRQALKELVASAKDRIMILAGGGITKDNYVEVVKSTGVKEVHGTKIVGNLG